MIIRARCLQPIGEPTLDNGAMVIEAGRIEWLGRWRDCERSGRVPVRDLGEVAIVPGFINAHCHLDYTSMAGKIPPPKYFPDWVKTILSLKAHWGYSEFAGSWLEGARMLVESGTTTVCDIESYPEMLPENWSATPLRVFSFLEMTGVKDQRQADEVLQETLAQLDRITAGARNAPGLSPHALYSTTPELMRKAAAAARERGLRLTTHVSESEAEFQMFHDAHGPFYDWLKNQRQMADCGRTSPVQLLKEYGMLGPDTLLAHGNYLAPGDEEILGRTSTSVVHCPRSHEYFEHRAFPFDHLEKKGVNLCLGTDSLATTLRRRGEEPRLSLWEEMELFASRYPGVRPRTIFEMVTLNPARALRKSEELGQLKPGAAGDFVSLCYSGKPASENLYESLLHEPAVQEVYIAGQIAHPATAAHSSANA